MNVGKAFQITDDILDITGHHAVLGKQAQVDIKNKTLTLPIMFALQDLNFGFHEMEEILNSPESSDLIRNRIVGSDIIDKCYEKALHFANKALHSLKEFPDSEYKTALSEIALLAINRVY